MMWGKITESEKQIAEAKIVLKAKKTRAARRRAFFVAKQNNYDDTGPELGAAFIGDTSKTQGCGRPLVITRIDNRFFRGNKQT